MKLTVALVTFNRPEYLRLAIEAIINQTFVDFEFLILDNGSANLTYEIIKSFSDKRIKYIRNEVNDVEFLNYPFVIANGEYIIIVHDDDIMDITFLEREVSILDKYQHVFMVGTNISHININGEILKEKIIDFKKDIIFHKYEFINAYLWNGNFLSCPTLMMRTSLIKKYEFRYNFEIGPMVDLYLNFQINLRGMAIYFINDPIYSYRIHENQDSKLNGISMAFRGIPFLMKLLKDSNQTSIANEFEQSALSQLFYAITLGFFTGKLTFGKYIHYVKIIILNGLKFNKYLFHWFFGRPMKIVIKKFF
jgi:GT2 family glycosyltransferase